MNRVDLVGRLTKDPELKATTSNIYFCNFILAVNRPFSQDNSAQKADFINCIVWRKQAENLAKYVKKGSLISVEGRISTRTFEANDGQTRYVTEILADSIQYLESRSETQNRSSNQSIETQGKTIHESHDNDDDDLYENSKNLAADDDLPF